MSNLAKIAIPSIIIFGIYLFSILMTQSEIGSFDSVRAAGEINQNVKVIVVKEKGFNRDNTNNIVSFIAKDRDDQEAIISLRKPAPANLSEAEVIELFGHMHQNNFIAVDVTVVR
jgi:cytochrome c-type biogenesis protein CcmE